MVSFTPSTTVYAVDRSISQFCRASEAKAVTSKTGVAISRQSKNSKSMALRYILASLAAVSGGSCSVMSVRTLTTELITLRRAFRAFSLHAQRVSESFCSWITRSPGCRGLLAFHKCSVSFRRAGEKYIELLYQVKKGNEVEA